MAEMLPYMNPYAPGQVGDQKGGGWGVTADYKPTVADQAAGDPKKTAEMYKKQAKYGRWQMLSDPFAYQDQQMGFLRNDPMHQQYANAQLGAYKNYQSDLRGMGAANRRFDQEVGSKGQWMGQADRAARKYGQAATQQASMDIARQGAMQSRGGMSPAAVRQSMMQQGQTSAGMQAQIAAQRMQARQEAQRSYLAARQQGLQNRQQLATMRGQQFGMAGQARGQAAQETGGAAQIGSTAHANQMNVLFNEF